MAVDRSKIAVRLEAAGRTVTLSLPDGDRDLLQRAILRSHSFYDRELLEHAATLLEPDDLVVDVGAHVGNHALFFAVVCRTRVVAFEPNPAAFDILCDNISDNPTAETVVAHKVALGCQPSAGRLVYRSPSSRQDAQVVVANQGPVTVKPLDSFALGTPVALMRIDTPGMELEVLHGAQKTILRDQPLLYVQTETRGQLSAVLKLVRSWAYVPLGQFGATPTTLCVPREHALASQRVQLSMASHQIHQVLAREANRGDESARTTTGEPRLEQLNRAFLKVADSVAHVADAIESAQDDAQRRERRDGSQLDELFCLIREQIKQQQSLVTTVELAARSAAGTDLVLAEVRSRLSAIEAALERSSALDTRLAAVENEMCGQVRRPQPVEPAPVAIRGDSDEQQSPDRTTCAPPKEASRPAIAAPVTEHPLAPPAKPRPRRLLAAAKTSALRALSRLRRRSSRTRD